MIIILNYGVGNLNSIVNLCNRIGVPAKITSSLTDIASASKIILPGVGNFSQAMRNLVQSGLISSLEKRVLIDKVPLLGVCVGMQLLAKRSEEGNSDGLGWLDADVVRFRFEDSSQKLRVPHVGFNSIETKSAPLFNYLSGDSRFYFTHSYHLICSDPSLSVGTTVYGYPFTSVIQKENIFGTQFHPEKSHHSGINLIRGFVEAC